MSIITIFKIPRLEGFTVVDEDGPSLMSIGYTPNREVESLHMDPLCQTENVPSDNDIQKQ